MYIIKRYYIHLKAQRKQKWIRKEKGERKKITQICLILVTGQYVQLNRAIRRETNFGNQDKAEGEKYTLLCFGLLSCWENRNRFFLAT